MGLDDGELPDFEIIEEWFDPATALVTTRTLRGYLHSHPESFEDADWVAEDLDAVTTTLTLAE